MKREKVSKYNTKRREIYANAFDLYGKIAFVLILLTFLIYIFQIFEPQIPIEKVAKLWSMSSSEFSRAIDSNNLNWAWVKLLSKSDYMNYLAVIFLATIAVIANFRILPILLIEKDYKLAVISLLQIIVIILAASGILKY